MKSPYSLVPSRRAAVLGTSLGLLGAALAIPAQTQAQQYPDRPIRVVIPVAAGGGTDIVGRLIGRKISESLGQPVVIENRPGGGSNIGAAQVARAQADGYTLLLTYGANITVNPSLYKNAGFEPNKDFAPVTQIAAAPYLLVAHPSVAANNIPDLIALIRQKKDGFNFATAPMGSPDHLAGELFKKLAGVELQPIYYKGSSDALVDVVGGRVPIAFATLPSARNHVSNKALKPLGVTSTRRSPLYPDVAPISDAVPGFEIATWYGIWAPAGTSSAIIDRVQREVRRAVALPDVVEFFGKSGFTAVASTPAEFAAFNKREAEQYAAIIKAANFKLD